MNCKSCVSKVDVVKVFLIGGYASLIVTMLIEQSLCGGDWQMTTVTGSMGVSLVEELVKVMVAAWFLSRVKGELYLLHGLVYGGAVGAGFAVFETAGYAFRCFCQYGFEEMVCAVLKKAWLAPGGNMAWTALAGFAMAFACEGTRFSMNKLFRIKFISIFLVVVALHGLWLAPVYTERCKWILLTIVAWVFLSVFIERGKNEMIKTYGYGRVEMC